MLIRKYVTKKFIIFRTKNFNKEIEEKTGIAFYKLQFYILSVINLIINIRKEPWFYNIETYFSNESKIPNNFKMCYIIEMCFYLVELSTIIYEPKKKDYKQMILHHLSTLTIMYLSFTPKIYRYGIAVILIHNISDPFLEFSKMENYLGNKSYANVGIFLFMLVFIISRLIIYPKYLVYNAIKTLYKNDFCISSILISFILIMLQIMHIIWSKYIIQLIIRILKNEKIKDTRE